MKLKTLFINQCYNGDTNAYKKARKKDYCKVQLEWSYFIDSLCKDGLISKKKYDNAVF